MANELQFQVLQHLVEGLPADVLLRRCERAGLDTKPLNEALFALHFMKLDASKRRENSRSHALWMDGVYRALQNGPAAVPEKRQVIADEFYEEYYAQNRPVLIGEATHAEFAWTFPRMVSELGHMSIEAMRGRSSDEDYDLRPDRYASKMTLAHFIDEILSVEGNDLYLTAGDRASSGPFAVILDDFHPMANVLNDSIAIANTKVFMGPTGSFARLHFDAGNVMMIQLLGTKRITLVPPYEYSFLYKHESMDFSRVDVRSPDLERYPLFQFANPVSVLLPPGSALFVPVGWWHFVESLEPSFSVSMTNFFAPNYFPCPD